MSKKPKHGYVLQPITGKEPTAFIPDPSKRGRWMKVHPCVLVFSCPYPGCGAKPGKPCVSVQGINSTHHYVRDQKIPKKKWSDLVETCAGMAITLFNPMEIIGK